MPPRRDEARVRIRDRVVEPLGETLREVGDARRFEKVRRGADEAAARSLVEIVQGVAERAAQGHLRADLVRALGRYLLRFDFRGVDGAEVRTTLALRPVRGLEPLLRLVETSCEELAQLAVRFERLADDRERIPEVLLDGDVLRLSLELRELHAEAFLERLERFVILGGAELVSRAVRLAPLDAVLPALRRAVDDCGRLVVDTLLRHLESGENVPEVVPLLDVDHVPVVKERELDRIPLDVVARLVAFAADLV